MSEILTEFTPDEVAIERVCLQRNVESALKLGQARGVWLPGKVDYTQNGY